MVLKMCVYFIFFKSTGNVIFTMIGDEDHRVRSAVANCLTSLIKSWTTTRSPSNIVRAKWLASVCVSTTQNYPQRLLLVCPSLLMDWQKSIGMCP
jgi:hypothetical protein